MTYLDVSCRPSGHPGHRGVAGEFSEQYMSMGGISNVAIIVYGLIMVLTILFEP
jgi:hypothetical protein